MELQVVGNGTKYTVEDKKGKLLYTIKKKSSVSGLTWRN